MRILVGLTIHPVPPTDGVQLHAYHLLRELNRRHDVTLVTAPNGSHDTDSGILAQLCARHIAVPVEPARSRLAAELGTLLRSQSKVAWSVARSQLADAVVEAATELEPDVVHLEAGALAVVAERIAAPTVLVPLDANDLNAAASRRLASGRFSRLLHDREARRWRRFEQTYATCDAVVVVGERDADMLRATDPRLNPYVIPNGVDTEWFSPGPPGARTADVVLHGAMDYPPNVDAACFAAREILPLVRAHHPSARLVLAGRNPSAAVRALESDVVEVTGALPDLRPVLRSAGAYLCPMRVGSGIKNKLLEALACGCPTVATRLATNGVSLVDGQDILVADEPAALAEAVVLLLGDRERAAALGARGRRVAESMSWAATAAAFDEVYRDAQDRRA